MPRHPMGSSGKRFEFTMSLVLSLNSWFFDRLGLVPNLENRRLYDPHPLPFLLFSIHCKISSLY